MLQLQHLTLFQFKNYLNQSFDFNQQIIAISGKNGVGKTNLLDAIHYLCFTKSYFTRLDVNNVSHHKNGFRLEGGFELNDKPEKAVCIFRENGRKEFLVNEEPYAKFSEHIGRYPLVIVAPDDAQLITGDSKERRKFLDAILCQADPVYLQNLISYRKILDQRNALLRSLESCQKIEELLDILDEQILEPGAYIFNRRKEFLISFLPITVRLYHEIAKQSEEIELFYETELMGAAFSELLKINRQKDCLSQRTNSGIHRDELEIVLSRQPFRTTASQGQRKSLLLALKLAEMEVLKKEKKFSPLLLLDDIFEKLDEDRINNLLIKVCLENDGQVFITDTHEQRLHAQLTTIGQPFHSISL